MRARVLVGCLVLAILAGCARFHPAPIDPARNVAALQSRSLANAALKTFLETNLHQRFDAWPPRSWNFDMLTLTAFYYHPSLDVARGDWAVATAGQITSGERPNPALTVLPGYDTTTSIPSPWLPLATLDFTIETAGKRRYRVNQSTELSEAARLKIASVAWQVRGAVRKSLVQFHAAREQASMLKQEQQLQNQNAQLLERQFQNGAVSGFELTQARIERDSTRLATRDAEQSEAEARSQLADALGVPLENLAGVNFSYDNFERAIPEPSIPAARRQALLNRTDVLAALAEYAASQSALQLEIAKQYPDLQIGPGYQFNQGDNQWLIQASLNLPIFNHNQGGVAEALARRAQSAAQFNAAQAKAMSEIDRAAAAYHVSLQRQADAEVLLAQLRAQEKTSQGMLQAGEISPGDLVNLRLQRMASQLARLDAIAKSQAALGDLEDALQSPIGLNPNLWLYSPRPAELGEARAP